MCVDEGLVGVWFGWERFTIWKLWMIINSCFKLSIELLAHDLFREVKVQHPLHSHFHRVFFSSSSLSSWGCTLYWIGCFFYYILIQLIHCEMRSFYYVLAYKLNLFRTTFFSSSNSWKKSLLKYLQYLYKHKLHDVQYERGR